MKSSMIRIALLGVADIHLPLNFDKECGNAITIGLSPK